MTTAQQRRLYFPAWRKALAAAWVKQGDAYAVSPRARNIQAELAQRVLDLAQMAAARRYESADADALRHACHVVALGRDLRSSDLTNRQLDRMLAMFRVLASADDVQAVLDWENTDRADRTRLIWRLNHLGFPEAYIATVCTDKFGTSRPDTLTNAQLLMLVTTLSSRARAKAARSESNPF